MRYLFLLFFLIYSYSYAGSCPVTKNVTLDRVKWNEHDQEVMEKAKGRCKVLYKDLPCLKKFKKIEDNRYFALCGKYNK
jgi:hypothetical protein